MGTDTVHFQLMGLLRQFSIASDRYADRVAALNALHRTDLNALAQLVGTDQAPLTPSRLRNALNLSAPATTALLDRLEGSGHITRRRSANDRRQVQLEMTNRARDIGKALFSPLSAELGRVFAAYSAEELELVERFMSDVLHATDVAREHLRPIRGAVGAENLDADTVTPSAAVDEIDEPAIGDHPPAPE